MLQALKEPPYLSRRLGLSRLVIGPSARVISLAHERSVVSLWMSRRVHRATSLDAAEVNAAAVPRYRRR